jgi:conjugative transfer region protein (TIGR03748 family)
MGRLLIVACLAGALSACAVHSPRICAPLPAPDSSAGPARSGTPAVEIEQWPELHQGRYTRLSTRPTAEQQDLLMQIVEVNIPSALTPSLRDALQHVLQRTGYSLCPAAPPVQPLFTRPLPAAHYRLGPIPLQGALQLLAGPAWQLLVDQRNRAVCFEPRATDSGSPATADSACQVEAQP